MAMGGVRRSLARTLQFSSRGYHGAICMGGSTTYLAMGIIFFGFYGLHRCTCNPTRRLMGESTLELIVLHSSLNLTGAGNCMMYTALEGFKQKRPAVASAAHNPSLLWRQKAAAFAPATQANVAIFARKRTAVNAFASRPSPRTYKMGKHATQPIQRSLPSRPRPPSLLSRPVTPDPPMRP